MGFSSIVLSVKPRSAIMHGASSLPKITTELGELLRPQKSRTADQATKILTDMLICQLIMT